MVLSIILIFIIKKMIEETDEKVPYRYKYVVI